jgi:hypothetical protein
LPWGADHHGDFFAVKEKTRPGRRSGQTVCLDELAAGKKVFAVKEK